MAKQHTRETDEQLLIAFVRETGWDEPDLMEAVARLETGLEMGLQDYLVPMMSEDKE